MSALWNPRPGDQERPVQIRDDAVSGYGGEDGAAPIEVLGNLRMFEATTSIGDRSYGGHTFSRGVGGELALEASESGGLSRMPQGRWKIDSIGLELVWRRSLR
jgi:hypothetical protein